MSLTRPLFHLTVPSSRHSSSVTGGQELGPQSIHPPQSLAVVPLFLPQAPTARPSTLLPLASVPWLAKVEVLATQLAASCSSAPPPKSQLLLLLSSALPHSSSGGVKDNSGAFVEMRELLLDNMALLQHPSLMAATVLGTVVEQSPRPYSRCSASDHKSQECALHPWTQNRHRLWPTPQCGIARICSRRSCATSSIVGCAWHPPASLSVAAAPARGQAWEPRMPLCSCKPVRVKDQPSTSQTIPH